MFISRNISLETLEGVHSLWERPVRFHAALILIVLVALLVARAAEGQRRQKNASIPEPGRQFGIDASTQHKAKLGELLLLSTSRLHCIACSTIRVASGAVTTTLRL